MELERQTNGSRPSRLDLGCGSKKTPGAFGVDIYPYPGVDQVMDLNKFPWALPDNSFTEIYCRHIIEHVADVAAFMREIHRISASGARLVIETPHFSSVNSWTDPTHVRHLSAQWYTSFLPGQYLAAQCGAFELINSNVTFGKSLRNVIGKWIARLIGIKKWEKTYAFSYPGMDIQTELRVIK